MVLWCRFQWCLGTFSILLVKASSETRLFRHLSDYVFGVPISKMQNLWGSFFNLKCLKVNLDFKDAAKNREKAFSFLDNCIGGGILNLSLWRTSYFSSAANVLTSSPKILDVNKRDFFQLKFFGRDQWIW